MRLQFCGERDNFSLQVRQFPVVQTQFLKKENPKGKYNFFALLREKMYKALALAVRIPWIKNSCEFSRHTVAETESERQDLTSGWDKQGNQGGGWGSKGNKCNRMCTFPSHAVAVLRTHHLPGSNQIVLLFMRHNGSEIWGWSWRNIRWWLYGFWLGAFPRFWGAAWEKMLSEKWVIDIFIGTPSQG